ncbi:MAG: DoxX family protein [Bacteroidetes bacterium]|nr:DoxX family protein [Bacteroidota bacterium]
MQKIFDSFSRYFVGALFIFSGLIKLNDPIGTQIKMEEYFEVFADDFGSFFHHFIPWSLEIGMIMIVLELALGVGILVFWRMKITGWVLLLLMVFFTFLTFYSAYLNKVTDCGCFGDAIKLTPWQSFTKDMVLMVFVVHLFWYKHTYVPALRTREGDSLIGATVLLSLFLGTRAINHLPFVDFRAYKVGSVIPQQMQPQEQPIIEYVFEKDGKEIKSQKYLMESGYKYVSSNILNEDKIKPKITDYNVTSPEGEDKTEYTFEGNRLLIVIANADKASLKNIKAIRELTQQLEGKVDCFILTASSAETIEKIRHENNLAVPFYFVDATVLKTIIRSNPGIALWQQGKVLGNWHHNDTPTAEEIQHLIATQ